MNKARLVTYWQNMPWNMIKLHASKHLPEFIFVVLLLLLAQTFAELTWAYLTPAQDKASIRNSLSTRPLQSPLTKLSLQKVSSYHLFGDVKQAAVVTQQKIIDAPETRLRLDLKGVFASTKASQALAIISSNKGKDKTYHIGDKITGGALLHAVYADRVILKRSGKLETLRLPKSKLDSRSFYSKAPSDRLNSQSNDARQSNQQRLRKIRDTLLNDPAKLWQQMRINPVMKNGKIQGYSLVHNDPALMKALNIRSTDVITSINGQSLSNPSTLYGLMNNLSKMQTLVLNIERNGQQQTIQLNF